MAAMLWSWGRFNYTPSKCAHVSHVCHFAYFECIAACTLCSTDIPHLLTLMQIGKRVEHCYGLACYDYQPACGLHVPYSHAAPPA